VGSNGMKDDIKPAAVKRAGIPPVVIPEENTKPSKLPQQEPKFRLPESIATEEDAIEPQPVEQVKKPGFKLRLPQLSKKQWIIFGVVLLVIIGGGTTFALTRKKPVPAPAVVVAPEPPPPPPPPTTEPSKLTGIEIPIELNKLPVTGIMIENSPDARPQAGLKDAGIVVEMMVEGGITRFLALFQESKPDHVGPVRSVRPPYLDFVMAFDAGIAHAGGSGEALSLISTLGLKDLDHGPNGGSFQRSESRYAPHNLYTSLDQMIALQQQKGYSSNFSPLLRKKEAPAATPTARTIDMLISGYLYNTHWDYDAATNTYGRSQGGRPHTDERSGEQIRSKTVLALVMEHHYAGIYSVYGTTGSGKAYIFQDGVVTEATWTRAERKSQITLTDAAGAPLGLNPGHTWITLVSAPDRVTFSP
jgi:hypothetical protein